MYVEIKKIHLDYLNTIGVTENSHSKFSASIPKSIINDKGKIVDTPRAKVVLFSNSVHNHRQESHQPCMMPRRKDEET